MAEKFHSPAPQAVVIVDESGERGLSPVTEVDDDYTGIKTVPTAGVAVAGPNTDSPTGFWLKGHPDNTDTVWFFPRGRTKANGFPLNAKEVIFANVKNLSVLSFDADVSGEKVCWSKV